jgi:hypothetical protein
MALFKSKFKSGIEDKTEKRIESLSQIRSKKKEEKFRRIKRDTTTTGNGGNLPFQNVSPWMNSPDGLSRVYNFLEQCTDEKMLDASILRIELCYPQSSTGKR